MATALYFSVSTATTVGYGDIILTPAWQVLGTFESMSGLILFGASVGVAVPCNSAFSGD
ncbi:MAG: ion channel [Pseudomonadota bacterium]